MREAEVATLNAQRERENLLRSPETRRPPVAFHSKVDLLVAQIRAFQPLRPGRGVCVLFDSWYCNRSIIRAAREKGLDWCSTLKRNRALTLV